MTLYIGFDVGTQGLKALCIDADSQSVVARAGRSYGLIPGLPPGAAEQHPDSWIDALRSVMQELRVQVDVGRVAAVGVSGQQHGAVVLDGSDDVIRPAKLWCDTTTSKEAAELGVPAGFTASKLLWLKRHEDETWARIRSVLLPHEYVNFRLTGAKVAEAGDASGTGYFDVLARCWDSGALERIGAGVEAWLPPLVDSSVPAGFLNDSGAELLGLRAGVAVSAGGGDNMMSAIGSGATRPGVVVVSLGTSGTVFTQTATPTVDRSGLIAPFCDSTGAWLPLLCVMNMTGVLEEVRLAFDESSHESLTALAREVRVGAGGLRFLPYLQGERVPDLPRATGVLSGLRPGLMRSGYLYRAALEGTALTLARGVERMRGLGVCVDSVRLVGGGAKNPLWCEILADALNAPARCLAESESAALGAALQAHWMHRRQKDPFADVHELAAPYVNTRGGSFEPDRERVAAYAEIRDELRGLEESIWA